MLIDTVQFQIRYARHFSFHRSDYCRFCPLLHRRNFIDTLQKLHREQFNFIEKYNLRKMIPKKTGGFYIVFCFIDSSFP
jgi:hypothetical protein